MPFKVKKQVLMSKIETTYGVDPAPVGATDSVLASNIRITPMEINSSDRSVVRGFFGSAGKIVSGAHVKFGFDIEAFTSGVAGTPAAYGPLMKACAQSENVSAGVSVTYAGVSAAEQAMTHYFNRDGKLRKISGWRGSVKLKMSPKSTPMWSFDGIGLYTLATDTVMPAATLTAWKTPLPVSAGITTASLHGYSGIITEFNFDQGNNVVYRDGINGEGVYFVGRKTTASLTMEEPTMAQKDFESIVKNGTLGVFTLTHGTVAGSKLQVNGASVQVTSYAETAVDDIAMIQLGLEFLSGAAGNDEYSHVQL